MAGLEVSLLGSERSEEYTSYLRKLFEVCEGLCEGGYSTPETRLDLDTSVNQLNNLNGRESLSLASIKKNSAEIYGIYSVIFLNHNNEQGFPKRFDGKWGKEGLGHLKQSIKGDTKSGHVNKKDDLIKILFPEKFNDTDIGRVRAGTWSRKRVKSVTGAVDKARKSAVEAGYSVSRALGDKMGIQVNGLKPKLKRFKRSYAAAALTPTALIYFAVAAAAPGLALFAGGGCLLGSLIGFGFFKSNERRITIGQNQGKMSLTYDQREKIKDAAAVALLFSGLSSVTTAAVALFKIGMVTSLATGLSFGTLGIGGVVIAAACIMYARNRKQRENAKNLQNSVLNPVCNMQVALNLCGEIRPETSPQSQVE